MRKLKEEMEAILERFVKQYWTSVVYSVGIGGDSNGDYCIKVQLKNDDGLDTIPAEFEGLKVEVEVDEKPIALCKNCRGVYNHQPGPCSKCGYETNSRFELCRACSWEYDQCQHCRVALNLHC